MRTLNEDLKNRSFRRIYLLFGEEAYLIQFYYKKLKEAIAGEDEMNTLVMEGQNFDLPRAREFTETMPFFADRRLMILKNSGIFSKSMEGTAEWLETLPETATVLAVEESVDKRNKAYKKASEIGHAVEFLHPDDRAFSDWLLRYLKRSGLSITRDAYELLLDRLPRDLYMASLDMDKVVSYCLTQGSIQKSDVAVMLGEKAENRIFDLIEAVELHDRERALSYYMDLIALDEPPLRILFLLEKQYSQLRMVKRLASGGLKKDEIAGAAGLKPFVAGKLLDRSRRFSLSSLENAVRRAVDLETAVKSGNLKEDLAPELFIFAETGDRPR